MSDRVKKLNLPGNEAQNLTGEQSKMEHNMEQEKQEEGAQVWEQRAPTIKRLFEIYNVKVDDAPGYEDIDSVVATMVDHFNRVAGEYNRLKERYKVVKAELEKMQELHGKLPKEKKQGGRKRKAVDWTKYDLLKQAGLSEKQMAEYMGIGASTLRRYRAERKQKYSGE